MLFCAQDPEVLSRRFCQLTSLGAREARAGVVGAGPLPPPLSSGSVAKLKLGSWLPRTSSWIVLRRTSQRMSLELSP